MKTTADGITEEGLLRVLARDPKVRLATVRGSLLWFIRFYFPHFLRHPSAPFQREIVRLLEDESHGLVAVAAFRGSAKSTIVTTAYALWSILGGHGKRHVLLLSQTREKSQRMLADIRAEMEGNERLRADLGPFREETSAWGTQSLVIGHLDARITAGSVGQSIRGVRHRARRPDLMILDDVEDLQSVKTREGRDRTWEWLTGEVVPAGDVGTRIVAVGNLLHADAVMPRLGGAIASGEVRGAFRKYAIVDERGEPTWPGKYPTREAVEEERKRVMDEAAWQREYMLNPNASSELVVRPEWIRTYRDLPAGQPRMTLVPLDLAVSAEESADYTAMVPMAVYGWGGDMTVCVLPQVVNERLSFPQSTALAKSLARTAGGHGGATVVVESNGFQLAYVQQLVSEGCDAIGVPSTADKRTRLAMTTHLIQTGRVLFPERGAERLIEQLVGFGSELHDDLADAFSLGVNYAMSRNYGGVRVSARPDSMKL